MATRTIAGFASNVTDTATPGTAIYTAPTTAGAVVRVFVYATNVGATLRNITVELDRGTSHPDGTGIVDLADNYTMPIEGLPIFLFSVVIYGHASDPDKLQAFVNAGSVNFFGTAVEIT